MYAVNKDIHICILCMCCCCLYRYSPQELKCLPVNTVLEKPQIQLQSKLASSTSVSITTCSIPITVSSNRPSNIINPNLSVQKADSDNLIKVRMYIYCKHVLV